MISKLKKCNKKTMKLLQFKKKLLMHHPPLNNAHI